MSGCRRGIALLEALVAMTIVSLAGMATIGRLAAATSAVRFADQEEQRFEAAQQVLIESSLFSRSDLDKRIGSFRVEGFVRSITRPQRALYRVAVTEIDGAERALLVTVLFRPGGDR